MQVIKTQEKTHSRALSGCLFLRIKDRNGHPKTRNKMTHVKLERRLPPNAQGFFPTYAQLCTNKACRSIGLKQSYEVPHAQAGGGVLQAHLQKALAVMLAMAQSSDAFNLAEAVFFTTLRSRHLASEASRHYPKR